MLFFLVVIVLEYLKIVHLVEENTLIFKLVKLIRFI